jgi:hypothetical protein
MNLAELKEIKTEMLLNLFYPSKNIKYINPDGTLDKE